MLDSATSCNMVFDLYSLAFLATGAGYPQQRERGCHSVFPEYT